MPRKRAAAEAGLHNRSRSEYASTLDAELPREAPPRNGMTLASFFCCGGGIDLGFRSAGFETVFANDIHKEAADTFEANLGHKPLLRNIREVGKDDYPPGEVDVVTGGFPCVTFSSAGKRMGVTDDENGKLYLQLCRVIEEIRPRYFVAENVRGMLTANRGNAVKMVLASFLKLGYRASYELVNMAEHGVPQTRERVIFVGVRVDQWRGSFLFPKRTHRLKDDADAPRWLSRARSVVDAIGDLSPPGLSNVATDGGDVGYNIRRKVAGKSTSRHTSKPRPASEPSVVPTSTHSPHVFTQRVLASVSADTAPIAIGVKYQSPSYHPGRPRPSDEPSLTVVSTGGMACAVDPCGAKLADAREYTGGKIRRTMAEVECEDEPVLFKPAENQKLVPGHLAVRRMSVRECARVQSFPDWYEFKGSQSDGYRIIGNAVPPLYAKRLAAAIAEYDAREIVR